MLGWISHVCHEHGLESPGVCANDLPPLLEPMPRLRMVAAYPVSEAGESHKP